MKIFQTNSDERPLSNKERALLTQLLLMTGREDRLKRSPWVDKYQLPSIHSICPKLRSAKKKHVPIEVRRDLFNRLLLNLSIMPVSGEFFNTVFGDTDFSDDLAIKERIKLFRIICMLDYGNFRYGYKRLRQDDLLIKKKWTLYFPSENESEALEREARFQNRPEPEGLIKIESNELFALGSLESEQLKSINSARETLRQIFTEALADDVKDFKGLKRLRLRKRSPSLTCLIAKAGLPGAEELLHSHAEDERSYQRILSDLLANCSGIDEETIKQIRRYGMQNAKTYMAMHDLDIYVATSMRAPLHFTTNWSFVDTLFHRGQLKSWKLRYFDPTQTFLPSRIQMGLLECLMIKRTKLTVYHAQESDTFGKDCEAGVTLAQAKPVVVFVTRLFDRQPQMESLYVIFDEAAKEIHRDDFIKYFKKKGLLSKTQATSLLRDPEKSKADAIEIVAQKYVPPVLRKILRDHLEMELIRQGYAPPDRAVRKFALDLIIKLERRALTFRDVHPLALQASPKDGVARGVIVTRTIDNTARVVSALLGDTLSYEIVDENDNWLLVDSITHSPVRVVTKDPVLTSAFWSEKWGSKDWVEVERGG